MQSRFPHTLPMDQCVVARMFRQTHAHCSRSMCDRLQRSRATNSRLILGRG